MEHALRILTDGAFKLFVYLCLLARRDRGLLEISQVELAKGLGKGPATIRNYLREMEKAGVCRLHGFAPVPYCRGTIEITNDFWPYDRQEQEAGGDAIDDFVGQCGSCSRIAPAFEAPSPPPISSWPDNGRRGVSRLSK